MKTALTHDISYIRAQIAGLFAGMRQHLVRGAAKQEIKEGLNAVLDLDFTNYVTDVSWDADAKQFVVHMNGSADDIDEYCVALSDYFPDGVSVEPAPWLITTASDLGGALTPLGMSLAAKRPDGKIDFAGMTYDPATDKWSAYVPMARYGASGARW